MAVFPLHVPGRRRDSRLCDGSAQCQGCQCTALSPQLLVALKSARRSAISAARCSAKRCLSSGVTLVSPLGCRTKGYPSLKGGSVTSLRHPAPGAFLRQGSPFHDGRWEVEVGQVSLKRPPVGYFLTAGDAGLRDPRKHQALGETVLVHPGHVSCPEQCAAREEVLKREDPVRFRRLLEVMW